ncbi:MAG: RES domain-containing protein [Acidobacteria bacterium]|nr:RES domain-containing protein [Acidobacteriota bacterium]
MYAYRIADARHPIFDPTGAMLHGGRWNSAGKRVIYAAETYAGALLEILVHANLNRPPKHQQSVRIFIPDAIVIEDVVLDQVHGWDKEDASVSQQFGDAWYESKRSAILRVPSVATQGREKNLVINTEHKQFRLITADRPEAVLWDTRLFGR